MSNPNVPRWQQWARFRFAVIGGLLSSPPESGELQCALQALAQKSYQHPLVPDARISPGFSTIERWYYQAKGAADPLAALGRKQRSDAGRRTAIGGQLKEALAAQYGTYKRWTVQLHNLVALAEQQPELGPVPSYKTILRCMRENGWLRRSGPTHPSAGQLRALERRERREVRSYEASHVHALWHLDFHHARIRLLDESGSWHHPIALAILDDHSRLCCHLQFYLAETAECMVHGLIQAILKRGLPRALMTDNGAAMLAEETRQGLSRLAIVHETTCPTHRTRTASRRSSGRPWKDPDRDAPRPGPAHPVVPEPHISHPMKYLCGHFSVRRQWYPERIFPTGTSMLVKTAGLTSSAVR